MINNNYQRYQRVVVSPMTHIEIKIRGKEFFSEDNRAKWNTGLFDYFETAYETTIDDHFGIWDRLVKEYGPHNGEPLMFQDVSHPFDFRTITRRGNIYCPLITFYEDVPRLHQVVTSTVLPIHAQYSIAEAIGATLDKDKGIWLAPHVNQKLWEDCLVVLILEYELYIVPRVMTDLIAKEALVMMNELDKMTFLP